jgi:hypothetical protein
MVIEEVKKTVQDHQATGKKGKTLDIVKIQKGHHSRTEECRP